MKKVILKIGGMSCSACSSGLEKYLNKQDGIINASVNLVMAQAMIECEDNITMDDLSKFVHDAGFINLGDYDKANEEEVGNEKVGLIVFGILVVLVLYISMSHMIHLGSLPFLDMMKYPVNYSISLFVLASIFLFYGKDIIISGIKNLLHKMPNMDTLVTIGVLSSYVYSIFNMIMVINNDFTCVENLYFESCAVIIFFIKLGRFVDSRNKEKTKSAIKELVQITPDSALLKTKDGEKKVTLDMLKKGDILICKPGMKIAVDGVITKGDAHLDEAFLTGESVPVKKKKNDKVIAGSINHDGYLEYEALKIGKDSTISEIVRLVVEASNTKAPIQKVADTVSSYFVPGIIIIAILTFLGYILLGAGLEEALISFVTVLVVACPCALGLATPLAIVIGEGVCAKDGILVKSSEILENVSKVDTIVFDKTGTLTYGELKISEIINYSDYPDSKIIEMVAALESGSTHPIAKAFTAKKTKKLEVKDFKNLAGMGLSGKVDGNELYVGNNKILDKLKLVNPYQSDEEKLDKKANSIVYVVLNKKIIALIGIKDIVKKDAKEVVEKLHRAGKRVVMLTGDNHSTAKVIADSIGIDEVQSNVLPKEKSEVIKNYIAEGRKVMMVGDGVNDALSLAVATVGVSITGSTDIAMDSSDVILMKDNLGKILDLILISNKTITNIKQNLFWAFFYNMLMIPLAIGFFKPLGLVMNPMFGGIAMTMSSLTVVLNALRLKKVERRLENVKKTKSDEFDS